MTLRTYTTIVQLIWMWILESVAHGKRIFVSYFKSTLSSKILEFCNCCLTYPDTNMSWCTDTPAIGAIWMWILVSLEYAQIIWVSYCINMFRSKDNNNLVHFTPPLQIWIGSWELIPQWFIWLHCENEHQWPCQREIVYHIFDIFCPLGYLQLGKC